MLDSRELYKKQQELQSDKDDLESELEDIDERVSEIQEEIDDEETPDATLFINLEAATEEQTQAREALQNWLEEYGEELEELNDLENEVTDFMHGVILIEDGEFKQYAMDLAEDLGMDRNQSWPYSCIDWDQAADELKMDYSSCTYQGTDYWFRS